MRTKIGWLLALFCIPLGGFAQEVAIATDSPEQAKKAIRELKLSEEYVYAEATTPISISEAQQNSKDLLQIYIVGILTGQMDLKKKEVDKKWEEMEGQCRNIVVKNGDLYKVCTYIGKEQVFPDWKKKASVAEVAVVETPAAAAPVATSVVAETPAVVAVVPQPVVAPEAKSTALSALPDKARSLVTELLGLKAFSELVAVLEKEKSAGRLVYGSIKNATSLANSYLIVFKKENPVIVLGPGTDQRTNFSTDAPDSMMKYVGYSIIWFQLF